MHKFLFCVDYKQINNCKYLQKLKIIYLYALTRGYILGFVVGGSAGTGKKEIEALKNKV